MFKSPKFQRVELFLFGTSSDDDFIAKHHSVRLLLLMDHFSTVLKQLISEPTACLLKKLSTW